MPSSKHQSYLGIIFVGTEGPGIQTFDMDISHGCACTTFLHFNTYGITGGNWVLQNIYW